MVVTPFFLTKFAESTGVGGDGREGKETIRLKVLQTI